MRNERLSGKAAMTSFIAFVFGSISASPSITVKRSSRAFAESAERTARWRILLRHVLMEGSLMRAPNDAAAYPLW